MAKFSKNSPQQLELRVFADVNSSSASHGSSLTVIVECKQQVEVEAVEEASPEVRAMYRAIADRYFSS